MHLRQHPDPPAVKRPIVIIGSGAVVRYAHLPAYRMSGFEVASIFDVKREASESLAREFGIPRVAGTLQEAVTSAPTDAVFDVATPAAAVLETLQALPAGASVLVQKPMGEEISQARAIREVCRAKKLKLSVNFQLRTAPYSLAARDLIDQGLIGDILEVDVKVHVHTPWALWYFLELAPRMEIVYHSIHYLDFIRCLIGDPRTVKANTLKHPASPKLHSSRSAMLLDYGPDRRAQVVTYHAHDYGPRHQVSQVRIEGTKGAVTFQMGLNMNYPAGEKDFFEYALNTDRRWIPVPLEGSWFPHAFRGPMSAAMKWAGDDSAIPETNFEDAYKTMALVEACYRDSELPGTPVLD
jgi:predicted dehydrogenase